MTETADDPTREEVPGDDTSERRTGVAALGDFIRSQRRLAELSQRELARLADLSDAYLSQLERGLHEPSVRVLNGLSEALNVPNDRLLRFLGLNPDEDDSGPSTESVIRSRAVFWATIRSTTISRVCFRFLASFGGSSRITSRASTRTTSAGGANRIVRSSPGSRRVSRLMVTP